MPLIFFHDFSIYLQRSHNETHCWSSAVGQSYTLIFFSFALFLFLTSVLSDKGNTLEPVKWGCASIATCVSHIAVSAQ